MSPPRRTTWQLKPHTEVKHLILRHYLGAWFPILARWNRRIVYYDGFAGPGRYTGGEPGSPLVALNVALEHSSNLRSEVVFVFVEKHRARAEHLHKEVAGLRLRPNFNCTIIQDEFETALRSTLDDLKARGLQIAPTFALVDPFGIAGLPFDLIARLLRQQRCEVLITFMNHAIERWVTELPAQINTLLGNPDSAEIIAGSGDRIAAARTLYEISLKKEASFVRFFEMRNTKNRPIYDLFFATNNDLGHYRMKEAMWKAGESGEFSFSDGIDPDQATLFSRDAHGEFAPKLWAQFRGQTVFWEEVRKFTRDNTPYLDTHARGALKLLESPGGVERLGVKVDDNKADGTPRRKNSYPDGTRIAFAAEPMS